MKRVQVPHKDRYSAVRHARGLGQLVLAVWAGALLSDPLLAAIDPSEGQVQRPALTLWTVAQTTTPPAATSDAVVPPVRRETPATPPAAQSAPAPALPAKKPDAVPAQPTAVPAASKVPVTPPPPEFTGVYGTIQEWLARANREYQGVVVKELSLPGGAQPAGEDSIAKKLKEQQAEDAQKAAAAKRAEDAARQAAEDKAAAATKAAEAKKLEEDRRRAEETKRLADEAKKQADELLKAEQPAPKAEPKPEVAAPAAPPQPKPDDAARLAEQQRLEAQKLAEEAKRQEQARKEQQAREAEQARVQEAQRKADETRRLDAERKKADAARTAAAAKPVAPVAKQTTRTIVLTPEPLPAPVVRPVDPGTTFRPEMAARNRTARAVSDETESRPQIVPQRRRIRVYHEATYRGITPDSYRRAHQGTAVKRWVWRSGHCNAAGQQITPPARYTIKRGDSLWRISEKHYHEGRLYPKIYRANRSAIADPDLIYPCQRVLVPRKR